MNEFIEKSVNTIETESNNGGGTVLSRAERDIDDVAKSIQEAGVEGNLGENVGKYFAEKTNDDIKNANSDGIRTEDESVKILEDAVATEIVAVETDRTNPLEDVIAAGNEPALVEGVEEIAKTDEPLAEEVAKYIDEVDNIKTRCLKALEKIEELDKGFSNEDLLKIGEKWSSVVIDEQLLKEATQRNGNPNSFAPGIIISGGNLPMSEDSIYRHVKKSAIADLVQVGFVRSKREAAGALDIPGKAGFGTSGAGVYWNKGEVGKKEHADLVIEGDKEMASNGYVTKDGIKGIWITDENGQAINLIY